MPPLQTDDHDPLELQDMQEATDEEDEEGHIGEGNGQTPEAPVIPELTPEVEDEIRRAMADDELEETPSPKSKSHLIPEDLINQPLDPSKDLWDEDSGSI